LLLLLDEIRPQTINMINKMKDMSFTITMLTGDHENVAKQVRYSTVYLSFLIQCYINVYVYCIGV
jgi:magnesium-transporting ATPase (P-type)